MAIRTFQLQDYMEVSTRIIVEGNDQNSEIERALVDSLVLRFHSRKAQSISILLDTDAHQRPYM